MFVKKFQAPTLEEALGLVKEHLGPDALVLSTQTKKSGWLMKKVVEVTVAAENDDRKEDAFDEKTLESIFPHRVKQNLKVAAKTEQIQGKEQRVSATRVLDPMKYESDFLKLGFEKDTSEEFSKRLVFDYANRDLESARFLSKVKRRLLVGGIRVIGSDIFNTRTSWVVTGLPGVGRTTFLVKLALRLKSEGRDVTLVSRDDRKVLGRSELATYAKLCGLPFSIEVSDEARRGIELIDCNAFEESKEWMDGMEKLALNRSLVVVLDSTSRVSESMRVLEKFSRFSPAAIAFSKVDCVEGRGALFEVLKRSKLPLLGISGSSHFHNSLSMPEPTEFADLILAKKDSSSSEGRVA